MSRLALSLLLLATLAGCLEPTPPATSSVARGFKVEKLFTVDGCTVYRFLDGGWNRYFTNCSGSASWSQDCGKGCPSAQEISGGNHQAGNERQLSPHETQPEPTPAMAPGRWIDERYQL
ncbi:DUF4884 domain-containing protein [Pseudomonas sp. URMO17WK12:I11]|uniref:DUF4884 domain-containing protein n=1 Tax=Pseudomonas sp. URMO17WK12:I11 TaxID=1283291 RepID=UPI00119EAF80|nr:DUF4884 domain-containing protein [Pseudomonas sp. URMO17WK12:I11]